MAWITDSNFGSNFATTLAVAPFATGGGNRILSIGAGLVYRDDIDQANISIQCDVSALGVSAAGSSNLNGTLFLIARRQPNGSFYTSTYIKANDTGLMGGGIVAKIHMYRYDGPSDTFFLLATADIFGSNPLSPVDNGLDKFFFRIENNSLVSRLETVSGEIIGSAGLVDNIISSSGNAGIGGHIVAPSGSRRSQMFIDNLTFNNI